MSTHTCEHETCEYPASATVRTKHEHTLRFCSLHASLSILTLGYVLTLNSEV